MKPSFSPKNNPRVIIIQILYGKYYNNNQNIIIPKHRFKKFIKDVVLGTIERNEVIITEIKKQDIKIQDISTDDGDLEDVFLRLTKN